MNEGLSAPIKLYDALTYAASRLTEFIDGKKHINHSNDGCKRPPIMNTILPKSSTGRNTRTGKCIPDICVFCEFGLPWVVIEAKRPCPQKGKS